MPQFTYSVNSINTWRMLLFGITGALLPIVVYIFALEFTPVDYRMTHKDIFSLLIIPVLALSVLGAWLGFKYSVLKTEIRVSDKGIAENIRPRLSFLPERKMTFGWQDISTYDLTEDSKGKILNIHLKNGHVISLGIAYVLNGSDDFDAFYSTFMEHLQNHSFDNTSQTPVTQSPDFYQSKSGRVFTWSLVTLMAGLLLLLILADKQLDAWDLTKLLFFGTMAGFFIRRSLFKKP